MVKNLLADIRRTDARDIEVILRLNIDEDLPFRAEDFGFPLRIERNHTRRGFGANHNANFALQDREYFCVLNPDVRLNSDPFPVLIAALSEDRIGVAAPRVINSSGMPEDSARRFPTPFSVAMKALGISAASNGRVAKDCSDPDWVAGMCMTFRASVFRELGGFDERYFLYYEDVDLCARLRTKGYTVALCDQAAIVHDAQRASHRRLRYLRWHFTSMLRFFGSRSFRSLVVSKRSKHNSSAQ